MIYHIQNKYIIIIIIIMDLKYANYFKFINKNIQNRSKP